MNVLDLIKKHYRTLNDSGFRGFDVYDGLNSVILQKLPLYRSRFFRLAWIQFFKRSPVNFRPLAMVPKGYNAKGLALFIQGLLYLYAATGEKRYLQDSYRLAEIIISQRSKGRDYFCVGYNFFWESKAFSVRAFTPNMIVSSFVAQAFLDLFEIDKDQKWLELAMEIGEFIQKELLLFESGRRIVFGYIPGEGTRVHNVNLMGSRLFARLYSLLNDRRLATLAAKSARYSAGAQRPDGSWAYGESDFHQWTDNFHTGFNLVALNDVCRYLSLENLRGNIESGLEYHIDNHFTEDMTPKYYDNSLYPIDIHNFAQGMDTMMTFGLFQKARRLLDRSTELMWDDKNSYFYYQKRRYYTNKINYIRWGQAWMFYSLTKYLIFENAITQTEAGNTRHG